MLRNLATTALIAAQLVGSCAVVIEQHLIRYLNGKVRREDTNRPPPGWVVESFPWSEQSQEGWYCN